MLTPRGIIGILNEILLQSEVSQTLPLLLGICNIPLYMYRYNLMSVLDLTL